MNNSLGEDPVHGGLCGSRLNRVTAKRTRYLNHSLGVLYGRPAREDLMLSFIDLMIYLWCRMLGCDSSDHSNPNGFKVWDHAPKTPFSIAYDGVDKETLRVVFDSKGWRLGC